MMAIFSLRARTAQKLSLLDERGCLSVLCVESDYINPKLKLCFLEYTFNSSSIGEEVRYVGARIQTKITFLQFTQLVF